MKVVAVDAELNVFYEDSVNFDKDLLEFGYVHSICVLGGLVLGLSLNLLHSLTTLFWCDIVI